LNTNLSKGDSHYDEVVEERGTQAWDAHSLAQMGRVWYCVRSYPADSRDHHIWNVCGHWKGLSGE